MCILHIKDERNYIDDIRRINRKTFIHLRFMYLHLLSWTFLVLLRLPTWTATHIPEDTCCRSYSNFPDTSRDFPHRIALIETLLRPSMNFCPLNYYRECLRSEKRRRGHIRLIYSASYCGRMLPGNGPTSRSLSTPKSDSLSLANAGAAIAL